MTPESSSSLEKASEFNSQEQRKNRTLDVIIATSIGTAASQLDNGPVRDTIMATSPILGLGGSFIFKLVKQLILRGLLISGAKKSCEEIRKDIKNTPPDRKKRIDQLEKQLDEASVTLKNLRTNKIDLDV